MDTTPNACACSRCLGLTSLPCLMFQVFKHHHEETTGRTSSIGQHNLCLDSKGQILNDAQFRNTTCGEYVKQASKVVTLVDLAGARRSSRRGRVRAAGPGQRPCTTWVAGQRQGAAADTAVSTRAGCRLF